MIDQDFPKRDDDTGQRVLIGLGGVIALALGTVITLGGGLIGLVAIVIAWFARRGGRRPLTRGLAWVISVASVIIPLLAFLLVSSLSGKKQSPEEVKRTMEQVRARQRNSPMQKLLKNQPQAGPAADSLTAKLLENRGFMFWFEAMAAIIGSSLLGAYAGTIAWGVWMIFYRAFAGEWMGSSSSLPPPAASF